MLEGVPSLLSMDFAVLGSAILGLAPLGEAASLGILRYAPPVAATALDAALRPAAGVAAAVFAGHPLSWGQPLAIVVLVVGAIVSLRRLGSGVPALPGADDCLQAQEASPPRPHFSSEQYEVWASSEGEGKTPMLLLSR